jgi:hypothetical protein
MKNDHMMNLVAHHRFSPKIRQECFTGAKPMKNGSPSLIGFRHTSSKLKQTMEVFNGTD